MKVNISGSRFVGVNKAFNLLEGSDIQLDATNNYFERVGEVLHVRSSEMPQPLKELVALAEKHGVVPEGVRQASKQLGRSPQMTRGLKQCDARPRGRR